MLIRFTLRYINIIGDDYESTLQSDFDSDLVFTYIHPMLGDDNMNRLEAVTYNGDTVHPDTTLADLGMVDGGEYILDVHFPRLDENSDDYSDRVLPSPYTSGDSTDDEVWYTFQTTTATTAQVPVGGQHPVVEYELYSKVSEDVHKLHLALCQHRWRRL